MDRTVTTHFTKAILKLIESESDVTHEKLDVWNTLHATNDRLPLLIADEIWEHCLRVSNDDLFGLRAGLTIHIGDLDIVGYLLMSCNTFHEAIEALTDYYPLIGEGGDFDFGRHNGDYCIFYSANYEVCKTQRIMAAIGSLMNFTNWLSDGAFVANAVHFAHGAPLLKTAIVTKELLGCDVHYDDKVNVLSFHEDMLQLPLIQGNAQVYERMCALVKESMENLPSSSFSHTVGGLIRKFPEKSKNEIAEILTISGRHLNRKLGREGLNFKVLQDKVRLELSETWLREKVHSQEIAERLGLYDAQSFFKVFKRWSGITPSQFLMKKKSKMG